MKDEKHASDLARTVYSKVTDEMLTKPVGELTDGESAILEAVLRGPFAEELMDRIDDLRGDRIE